jgi:hypothetical protein
MVAAERVGPLSTVGNEEFNQHLESSTGAGSDFDQNLFNSSVMIIIPTSPPIKAEKINIIHHQLLRQGANAKTVSSKGRIDQDRYPRHALQRSTGPKKGILPVCPR